MALDFDGDMSVSGIGNAGDGLAPKQSPECRKEPEQIS